MASDEKRIEWVANKGEGELVRKSDPDAKAGQQLCLWLTSRFVSEEML